MVIKILIFLSVTLSACNSKKNEYDSNGKDITTLHSANYVKLIEFEGRDSLEVDVFKKIREYLNDQKLDEECFYIAEIDYTTDSERSIHQNPYTVIVELIHWKTVVYFDSVTKINQDVSENNEFNEIYIPITGNISGEDRFFYYYVDAGIMHVVLIQ